MTVEFTLATAGKARVRMLDLQGRTVRVLADRRFGGGVHRLSWDLTTSNGDRIPPGLYFYDVAAGARRSIGRVVVTP
jgi:flagellar hook assembly protein FlgD